MDLDPATVDALLTTTRAVRRRLDFTRPVPEAVILECLELAIQAPTASNMQGWRWMIVTDPGKRADLAAIYRRAFEPYIAMQTKLAADAAALGGEVDATDRRVADSAIYLSEHLHEVPALVIPCIESWGMPLDQNFAGASFYGSIFPAVWSLQLALRSRGLGSALTTFHLNEEAAARDLLGIPANFVQACLLPVAYYTGTTFSPAPRRPLSELVHWNAWS
jgi:nitroreductase